jgi:hypothetical protein
VVVEPLVSHHDTERERARRGLGRPSKAEPYRARVSGWLAEEPTLLSVELLRRAKLAGYEGAKSALHELVREVRYEHSTSYLILWSISHSDTDTFYDIDTVYVDMLKCIVS